MRTFTCRSTFLSGPDPLCWLNWFLMLTHLQVSQSRSKNVSAGSRSLTVSWPLNSLGPKGNALAYDAARIMTSVFTTKKGIVHLTPLYCTELVAHFFGSLRKKNRVALFRQPNWFKYLVYTNKIGLQKMALYHTIPFRMTKFNDFFGRR